MDRRIYAGLIIALFALGCSGSSKPETAAAPSTSAASPPSESKKTEAPRSTDRTSRFNPPPSTGESPAAPWTAEAPPGSAPAAPQNTAPESYSKRTEIPFADDVVEGDLKKPESTDRAANPLRITQTPPGTPLPPRENPLRTMPDDAPAGRAILPPAMSPHVPIPLPDSSKFSLAPPTYAPPALAPSYGGGGGGGGGSGGIPLDAAISGSAPSQESAERMAYEMAAQERMRAQEQLRAQEQMLAEERMRARVAARADEQMRKEAEEANARQAEASVERSRQVVSNPPADGNLYDVVQVFYATDRKLASAATSDAISWIARFVPMASCLLATFCLLLIAGKRRNTRHWALVAVSAVVSLGLGVQATVRTLEAIRRAGQEGLRYTSGRAAEGRVDLGLCDISIPKTHQTGELESPSIWRLEVREEAPRHVMLRKTARMASSAFYEALRQRVADSERKELFVFVHGFNVSFEDAARRTAQIHYDLKFPGAPVFFSWPAHDKFLLTYPADETNVTWSASHLKKFLLEVVAQSEAKSINLIAHSMGNRALTSALREIELEMKDDAQLFNQVILAAPDIDAEDFRTNIAPAMQRTAKRMTLYASSRDDALLASQVLHRGPRAGDAGRGLVLLKGLDTVDVTAIDRTPWGHLYYSSSNPLLEDLKLLFTRAAAPTDRNWLSPAQREGLTYWIFQPERSAAADDTITR